MLVSSRIAVADLLNAFRIFVTASPSGVLDPVLFLLSSVGRSLSGLAGSPVPSSALASTGPASFGKSMVSALPDVRRPSCYRPNRPDLDRY